MPDSELTIPVALYDGSTIEISFFGTLKKPVTQIDEAEALEYGEARTQLCEGASYEYALPTSYALHTISRIVTGSRNNPSSGRITPGNYVGTLSLEIYDRSNGAIKGVLPVEVCSVKMDYRQDYRYMLEDITKRCTEILMQYTSPPFQHFEPDAAHDAQTLYQRFAFVKSLLDSPEFLEGIYRVLENPVTRWASQEERTDSRKGRRMNARQMRQLGGIGNRVPLRPDHPLKPHLDSLPATFIGHSKRETTDSPENRFVRHVLNEFLVFISHVRNKFDPKSRVYREAVYLESKLENILSHAMFSEVGHPSLLALNSPVLQRKQGYREVLRAWLMFDLAARLVWKGGLDVYDAGKRDVAALYEYWVFFVLLNIVCELFSIDRFSIEELFEETSGGMDLKLKKGSQLKFTGSYGSEHRKLRISFHYNRTFPADKAYPMGGSWTASMRPDYTLSIWPDGMEPQEAEQREQMVHLHFDAKYKLRNFLTLLETEEDIEDEAEPQSAFKREDLLKMHSYRDAIRRTAGAYILYPGDTIYKRSLYHELLPGIGALPLRPSRDGNGMAELRSFIALVVGHLLDPSTSREALAGKVYELYGSIP